MKKLGRNLVFNLRYQAEMDRLYWNRPSEETPTDLPDPAETLKMVQTVGDAARHEVAAFLEISGSTFQRHLAKFANCERTSRVDTIEKNWEIQYGVWLRRRPPRLKIIAGVYLYEQGGGEVIPWLWFRGSPDSIHTIRHRFGARIQPPPDDEDSDWRQSICISRIRIPPPEPGSLDVDAEPLFKAVEQAIFTVSLADLEFALSQL
jgi:hypothetical protein